MWLGPVETPVQRVYSPEERRKEPMPILLVSRSKEVAMEIIEEYLNHLAEATDQSEENFLGSYRGRDCN
jgi:hypothetical protein